MSEAEEYGYDGTYFAAGSPSNQYSLEGGGYISSSPPKSRKQHRRNAETQYRNYPGQWQSDDQNEIADVVFFDYGEHIVSGLSDY
jgi:hypothetical protein